MHGAGGQRGTTNLREKKPTKAPSHLWANKRENKDRKETKTGTKNKLSLLEDYVYKRPRRRRFSYRGASKQWPLTEEMRGGDENKSAASGERRDAVGRGGGKKLGTRIRSSPMPAVGRNSDPTVHHRQKKDRTTTRENRSYIKRFQKKKKKKWTGQENEHIGPERITNGGGDRYSHTNTPPRRPAKEKHGRKGPAAEQSEAKDKGARASRLTGGISEVPGVCGRTRKTIRARASGGILEGTWGCVPTRGERQKKTELTCQKRRGEGKADDQGQQRKNRKKPAGRL